MEPYNAFASDEPFQIHQDSILGDDFSLSMAHDALTAIAPKPSRRSSVPVPMNENLFCDPALRAITGAGASPSKLRTSSMSHPHPLKPAPNKLNTFKMPPPAAKSRNTDSLQKKPYLSKFKTVAQKPMTDSSWSRENLPTAYVAPTRNSAVDPFSGQKAHPKRALMDAAVIADVRPTKKPKIEPELPPTVIPPHDAFPPIEDNGTKPGHSYAMLIGMAILRSPKRRLTLSQIYKWISDTFRFYNPTDAGWQNSIRHNLSLHKEFIKVERPKDDPGKGHYWTIKEGQEYLFLSQRPTRKVVPPPENVPVMATRIEPAKQSLPEPTLVQSEPMLPPPVPLAQLSLPPLLTSQDTPSMPPELSSDATIPISDAAAPEEALEKLLEREPVEALLYSPLPETMHSSPPVVRRLETRSGTPPPGLRVPGSSASRSRKRKSTSMDDSGYISSLESSVMRPNKGASFLTSEADISRPRIKRGRAEDEIRRLRGSSYDSPTKGTRPWVPASSSPLRDSAVETHGGSYQMLPPLTPAVKMKAPPKPPPSASPNTTLRNHRKSMSALTQSPLRRVTGLGGHFDETGFPWSPAFQIDESVYYQHDLSLDHTLNHTESFEIFDDSVFGHHPQPLATVGGIDSSPLKPLRSSAKRTRVERSHSASALADITNSASNKQQQSFLKVPDNSMGFLYETPSKALEGLGSSPSKPFNMSPSNMKVTFPPVGEWPALTCDITDFISTENMECASSPGFDILQGFAKIGEVAPAPAHAGSARPSKPGFGRSYSTAF